MAMAVDVWFARAHLATAAVFVGGLLVVTGRGALRPELAPPARLWRLLCGPAAFLALFAGIGTLHLDQQLLTARWIHLSGLLWGGLLAVDALCQWALTRGRAGWMRPLFVSTATLGVGLVVVGLVQPGGAA